MVLGHDLGLSWRDCKSKERNDLSLPWRGLGAQMTALALRGGARSTWRGLSGTVNTNIAIQNYDASPDNSLPGAHESNTPPAKA